MKILIIEDDFDKRRHIKEFILKFCHSAASIEERESLRAGLKEIIYNKGYDLIILDMSLPNFDINAEEPGGGTPESFAGRELLAQMKLRGVMIPVIVITQYSSFDNGRVTLDDLKREFDSEYNDFYKGSVYYNAASDSWKKHLQNMIQEIYSRRHE